MLDLTRALVRINSGVYLTTSFITTIPSILFPSDKAIPSLSSPHITSHFLLPILQYSSLRQYTIIHTPSKMKFSLLTTPFISFPTLYAADCFGPTIYGINNFAGAFQQALDHMCDNDECGWGDACTTSVDWGAPNTGYLYSFTMYLHRQRADGKSGFPDCYVSCCD
jgi:hypothetical protein